MSRSIRMFEIIQLLRVARRPMTAQQIAEELEVNKRTVYRDIVSLQSMRVPIEGEAGIGYIMRPGYNLPPLMFNAEEIEAIVVGLSLLGRTGDAALQAASTSVRRKLDEVTQPQNASTLYDLNLFTSKWHDIPESQIDPQSLRQYVREEVKVNIDYCALDGGLTSRAILPLALVYYVDVVVLAAWCELREDFRHFRIDRIDHHQSQNQTFKSRSHELLTKWKSTHDKSF